MQRLLWVTPVFLLVFSVSASATSIDFQTFALQGADRVLLTPESNPILTKSSGCFDCLLFFTLFDEPTYSISYDLTIGLFHFTSSESGDCAGGCVYSQSFALPGIQIPKQGFLTVTFNGVSETLPFQFSAPAPEPGTLGLVSTGLLTLFGFAKKRYRQA